MSLHGINTQTWEHPPSSFPGCSSAIISTSRWNYHIKCDKRFCWNVRVAGFFNLSRNPSCFNIKISRKINIYQQYDDYYCAQLPSANRSRCIATGDTNTKRKFITCTTRASWVIPTSHCEGRCCYPCEHRANWTSTSWQARDRAGGSNTRKDYQPLLVCTTRWCSYAELSWNGPKPFVWRQNGTRPLSARLEWQISSKSGPNSIQRGRTRGVKE